MRSYSSCFIVGTTLPSQHIHSFENHLSTIIVVFPHGLMEPIIKSPKFKPGRSFRQQNIEQPQRFSEAKRKYMFSLKHLIKYMRYLMKVRLIRRTFRTPSLSCP